MKPRQMAALRRTDSGLTLVELMVSLTLAAILSAGLFYMMSGQSRTYQLQMENLTTQENIWGAMEYVQRNVRMAGFGTGGCPGGRVQYYDASGGGMAEARWLAPLRVYNDCSLLTTPDPTTCSGDGVDSITVAYSTTGEAMAASRITQPMPTSLDETVVSSPGYFGNNDLVLLWQPGTNKACTLLQLTDIPQALPVPYTLLHASTSGYNPNIDIFPAGGYDSGALVVNVTDVAPRHFAVDIDPTDPQKIPRFVTWTTPAAVPSSDTTDLEVVADGVEDLQLSYACDEDESGLFEEGATPGARLNDEWAHNAVGEGDADGNGYPDPLLCSNGIGLVRITLTARSPSEDTAAKTQGRPAAEDRAAGALDAYHRRKLTVLIHPRNARPL